MMIHERFLFLKIVDLFYKNTDQWFIESQLGTQFNAAYINYMTVVLFGIDFSRQYVYITLRFGTNTPIDFTISKPSLLYYYMMMRFNIARKRLIK